LLFYGRRQGGSEDKYSDLLIKAEGCTPKEVDMVVSSKKRDQGQASHLLKGDGGMHIPEAGSDLGAVLQQAHQHAALVVLATKEHGQHLDFPLLRVWTKPIHGTIQSQVAKAREEIIV